MTHARHTIEQVERYDQMTDALREGYNDATLDNSVPGSTSLPSRYVVVTESTRGHGYSFSYALNVADCAIVAAANLNEGWQPVCYFDLDELDGPEPPMLNATYQGVGWMVHGDEFVNGTRTGRIVLKRVGDRRSSQYEWEHVNPEDLSDEIFANDERNPKRYLCARIVPAVVVFNTVPTEA